MSDENRSRVLAAVRELAYRRNEVARNLRQGSDARLVGLLVTALSNPFYSQLAAGVQSVLEATGIHVILVNTEEKVDREASIVDDLSGRGVSGLILVPAGSDQSYLRTEQAIGIPVVLAARPPAGLDADCVLVDDFGGAREVTARLIDQGHRRIGFVGLRPAAWTGAERFRGFCAALEDAGIELDDRLVKHGRRDTARAAEATAELLAEPDPPTAIFSTNNQNTIGVIRAMRRAGVTLTVGGFDDVPLADLIGVPLELATFTAEALGRTAAQMLLDRLGDGADAPTRRTTLPVEIVSYPA